MATVNLIPEEKIKSFTNGSKSTESVYSSNSSKCSKFSVPIHRKKLPNRQPAMIPASKDEVLERVLSAKLVRVKGLHNRLAAADQTIAELKHENRRLRTLLKRQDIALAKYENTNAELPQLLNSQAEEVRMWQTKYRNIASHDKSNEIKIKQKDALIASLTDQNKHLIELSKEKHLLERERLTERVKYLEERLLEKDNDLKMYARKLQLESKSFRSQLQSEQSRYKDMLNKLEKARHELSQGDLRENRQKFPKTSQIPRSLSGSRLKNKFESSQCLAVQTESASLPAARLKSDSGKTVEESCESSASPSRTTIFLTSTKPDKKKSQRSELDEIIKKSLATAPDSDSQSDDDEPLNRTLSKIGVDTFRMTSTHDRNDFFEENENDHDDEDSNDVISPSAKVRETNFESIRRQMRENYKEHASFLDSFCKEATSEDYSELSLQFSNEDELPKRTDFDPTKKVKLLAALKAIDEEKGDDDK